MLIHSSIFTVRLKFMSCLCTTMRVCNLCTSHVSADSSEIHCISSETVNMCIKHALSSVREYRLYRGRTRENIIYSQWMKSSVLLIRIYFSYITSPRNLVWCMPRNYSHNKKNEPEYIGKYNISRNSTVTFHVDIRFLKNLWIYIYYFNP